MNISVHPNSHLCNDWESALYLPQLTLRLGEFVGMTSHTFYGNHLTISPPHITPLPLLVTINWPAWGVVRLLLIHNFESPAHPHLSGGLVCTVCSFSPVLFRWTVAFQVSTWTIASAPQLVRCFEFVWATTASLRVVGMEFWIPWPVRRDRLSTVRPL